MSASSSSFSDRRGRGGRSTPAKRPQRDSAPWQPTLLEMIEIDQAAEDEPARQSSHRQAIRQKTSSLSSFESFLNMRKDSFATLPSQPPATTANPFHPHIFSVPTQTTIQVPAAADSEAVLISSSSPASQRREKQYIAIDDLDSTEEELATTEEDAQPPSSSPAVPSQPNWLASLTAPLARPTSSPALAVGSPRPSLSGTPKAAVPTPNSSSTLTPSFRLTPSSTPSVSPYFAAASSSTSNPLGLSDQQYHIYQQALAGKSFLLSGSAGTGKSFLLSHIIASLRDVGKNISVTASTGVAAINIQGVTIHSWAGIGLGQGTEAEILKKVRSSIQAKWRWQNVDVLVVDEISMLPPQLFDLLDHIARAIRRNSRPFGGIQVLACGDFLQLPPVMTNAKDDDAPAFAFQAQSWTRCLPKVHILSEVFRQKDPEFIQLLQEIRLGRPSAATLATLRSRTVPMSLDLTITKKAHQEDLEPTLLFCDNAKVNQMNDRRLALLKTTPVVFTSVESSRDPMFLRQLDQVCLAPRELVLKRYAQVMLLKNLSFELKLVNGSQGIVVGFARDPNTGTGFCSPGPQDIFQPPLPFPPGTRIIPVVRFAMGVFGVSISSWQISDPSNPRDALATRHQIPLRLAWAVTIHKSQGLTLQSVDVDLSNCFSCGQMYTALSRVSSLEGLRIRGEWKNSAIWAHPEAIQFYNQESEKTAQTPEHPD